MNVLSMTIGIACIAACFGLMVWEKTILEKTRGVPRIRQNKAFRKK